MRAAINPAYIGRLGNQLFHAGLLLGLKWEHNCQGYFPYGSYSFINKLFSDIKTLDTSNWSHIVDNQDKTYQSDNISTYVPILHIENIMLSGYFQSYKYFDKYKDKLIELFTSNTAAVDSKYNELSKDNENTVAVHIRRGDYLTLKNHYHQLSENYYRKAISSFPINYRLIVFSDDIKYCKSMSVFKGHDVKYVDFDIDDNSVDQSWLQMQLMAKCKAFIIANSTFSWWAAYLSGSKIVFAPSDYYGPALKHITLKDYYPPYFITIKDNPSILEAKLAMQFNAMCVSLDTDIKRRDETRKELNDIGLGVEFILSKRHPTDPVVGCRESHILALREIYKRGYKHTLVLEDDARLGNKQSIESIKPFTYSNNYDILYLGCTVTKGVLIETGLIKTQLCYCTHAYIISRACVEYILSQVQFDDDRMDCKWLISERMAAVKKVDSQSHAIDVYYANWICDARGKSYALYPIAIYQRACYSNICGKFIDYSGWQDECMDRLVKSSPALPIVSSLDLAIKLRRERKYLEAYNMLIDIKEPSFDKLNNLILCCWYLDRKPDGIAYIKQLLNGQYTSDVNSNIHYLRSNIAIFDPLLLNLIVKSSPLVLIINMTKNTDRLHRMTQRLKHHSMASNIKVIAGQSYKQPTDELLKFMDSGLDRLNEEEKQYAAVYFDHLRAFRYLVNDTKDNGAFIMEDDAMLIVNFLTRATSQTNDNNIVLFSPYCCKTPGANIITNGLFKPYSGIFSTACYWVSRKSAIELLTLYDKPISMTPDRQGRISSEDMIMSHATTVCSYPPLAIEDCIGSNIQSKGHLQGKRQYWGSFGIANYQIPNENVVKLWL